MADNDQPTSQRGQTARAIFKERGFAKALSLLQARKGG